MSTINSFNNAPVFIIDEETGAVTNIATSAVKPSSSSNQKAIIAASSIFLVALASTVSWVAISNEQPSINMPAGGLRKLEENIFSDIPIDASIDEIKEMLASGGDETTTSTTSTTTSSSSPVSTTTSTSTSTSSSTNNTTTTSTTSPTIGATTQMFYFGEDYITVPSLGIEMSSGLNVKLIARTGQKVDYADGTQSELEWHPRSDAAGIVPLDPENPTEGGYVYMSNSEDADVGGVYGLYFDKHGNIQDYKALLTGTIDNCGGGLTPWHTWVSCEEETDIGQCWQVSADGRAEETVLGGDGGNFESVACDDRVHDAPVFFTTEDAERGAMRRFEATKHGWDALHDHEGTHSFLNILDDTNFEWTTDEEAARDSAADYYPNSEGIQVHEGKVFFMSKLLHRLLILDLESMTYTAEESGLKFYGEGSFGGQPDQIIHGPSRKYIYFTEDGSDDPGVYGRHAEDETYFTLFQAIKGGMHTEDETIGIAMSPDGRRLYAGFQTTGHIFEFTRQDEQSFE